MNNGESVTHERRKRCYEHEKTKKGEKNVFIKSDMITRNDNLTIY